MKKIKPKPKKKAVTKYKNFEANNKYKASENQPVKSEVVLKKIKE